MPRLFRRRRKWPKRVLKIFCIRRSKSEENLALKLEQQLLIELYERRCINQRLAAPFDEWEQSLWLAGVAVVAPKGAAIPVLDICLGFENYELKKLDIRTYSSYCDSHWDKVVNQQGFARLACEKYPDEPVVDGLPASVWLECVEPTLSILKSLSTLKHRKCNLTTKKNLTEILLDSSRSQHGDFMYGPFPPLLALPRRGVIRMEIRIGLRTESPNLIQSSFNNRPLSRNFNRRHRERQLYKVLQNDTVDEDPQEPKEQEQDPPASSADTAANTLRGNLFTLSQSLMSDGNERNTNQNANVQDESVGSRRPEALPDIEVVDLEQVPPDRVSNSDQASVGSNSRPETPRLPEWLVFHPLPPGLLNRIANDLNNDVLAGAEDEEFSQEEGEDQEDDSSGSSYDESTDQSEEDVEDEREEDDKDRDYGGIFEPRPAPVQQDSEVFYHKGHLVLNNWDLQRENEKCEDSPRYIWKHHHRLLEKKTSRVGPPETVSTLANTLTEFFNTETGEWKNSVAGAKLMRLAAKDSYTRRHVMLAFNKISEQREDDGPVQFRNVKTINKLSTLHEVPTNTSKSMPTSRRDRIRMRLRIAWSNLRFRFRMLRGRITGHYG